MIFGTSGGGAAGTWGADTWLFGDEGGGGTGAESADGAAAAGGGDGWRSSTSVIGTGPLGVCGGGGAETLGGRLTTRPWNSEPFAAVRTVQCRERPLRPGE